MKEKLLKEYKELEQQRKNIVERMNEIKQELRNQLENIEGTTKYQSEIADVFVIYQTRKQLQVNMVKKFLSDEELEQCYKENKIEFVKIKVKE